MNIIRMLCVGTAVMLLLAACGGDGGVGGGQTPTPQTREEAEDEIKSVVEKMGKAFSREDWEEGYELYAPSLREECRKGEYLAQLAVTVEFAKAFIGEEAWEALKDDLKDGYDIKSIDISGNRATVTTVESDEPLTLAREGERWWYWEEDPCEMSLFGGDETPEALETPEMEETPEASQTYEIGERVEVEDYPDIVVLKFARSTDPAEVLEDIFAEGESLEAGHEYLAVTIRVINDTAKPAGVSDFTDLTLLSRGEDITDALSYVVGVEGALDAETLPVGTEATGRVVWSARQGFDVLELVYRPEFGADGSFTITLEN